MRSLPLIPVALATLLLGLSVAPLPSWGADKPSPAVKETTASFTSGNRAVTVDRFEPLTQGKYPAVILVHGADGLGKHAATLRAFARQLAGKGHVAFVIHYFERTGTRLTAGQRMVDLKTIESNFLPWMLTVADAVTFARQQANVDPERIGLLGFSLGAYLVLSVATQDTRVSAVVDYYGGLPQLFAAICRRLPPVLILHGKADKLVSVEEAGKLERLLQKKKLVYEIKLYPRQGHVFSGDDARDAARRTIDFLTKYLKGGTNPARK